MTAPFMVSIFFYCLSIYGVSHWVTLATYFPRNFCLPSYSRDAITFTCISDFSVELLYHDSTHYQTIPYVKTLPNYTLYQYITKL